MKNQITITLFLTFTLFSCGNKITEQEVVTNQKRIQRYHKTKSKYQKTIALKLKKIEQLNTDKPEKYKDLKNKTERISKNSNDLNLFIENLKKESNCDYLNGSNFDLLSDTDFYTKILFNGAKFSKRGLALKEKIDIFYKENKTIVGKDFMLNKFNEKEFNTNLSIKNTEGKEINYLMYKLKNKATIEVLLYLEELQMKMKKFQFNYMNLIISDNYLQ